MRFVPYFLLLTLTQITSGLVAGSSRIGRAVALLVTIGALAFPLLLPADEPALRAALGLGLAMAFFRTIDLVRETKRRTPLWRILHVALPFDTRRIAPAPPTFSPTDLLRIASHFVVAIGAFYVAVHFGAFDLHEPPRLLLRWSAGLVAAVALTEAVYGLAALLVRGAGFSIDELHRRPLASRSVKEFWGERWNLTITRFFREHCVKPLARRRLTSLGIVASFLASALLHAYLVLVTVSLAWSLPMFLYFVLQGAFVFVERALHEERWRSSARRVWTFGVMIATSPLFIEPGLRAIGM